MAAMYLLDPNASVVATLALVVVGAGVFGLVCRGLVGLAGAARAKWREDDDERGRRAGQAWRESHARGIWR